MVAHMGKTQLNDFLSETQPFPVHNLFHNPAQFSCCELQTTEQKNFTVSAEKALLTPQWTYLILGLINRGFIGEEAQLKS